MSEETKIITEMIVGASQKAREETSNEPEPELTQPLQWPIQAMIGPGLEGAIACESKIGYVNGSKGWLIYRGYDIFDLCAYSTFEEVSYLLLNGDLPTASELDNFKQKLVSYGFLNQTLRLLMSSPVESMNTMSAIRLGTLLMRRTITPLDLEDGNPFRADFINCDEDSIPMETAPKGEVHAIYEFKHPSDDMDNNEACIHLIAGLATITAAVARIHQGRMPIEPDPDLGHAANLLYMMTGRKPTPVEERIMDIALILHADHGMNASTFAAMVVASTLSDIYFSVGSGIAALNGPLHGGANEQVVRTLMEIGGPENVPAWVKETLSSKGKVMGFGHRVYKAYDPRARVLSVLAKFLAETNESIKPLFDTAQSLEKEVVSQLGTKKNIFPNVDFFSGIVYSCLGIAPEMFTPIFAVSRVSGWTARILEYLENNRIFRPRAMYTGEFNKQYVPFDQREGRK